MRPAKSKPNAKSGGGVLGERAASPSYQLETCMGIL